VQDYIGPLERDKESNTGVISSEVPPGAGGCGKLFFGQRKQDFR